MATKKYTFLRVDKDIRDNLNNRVKNMNEDLKRLGAKKKVGQIDLLRFLSNKLLYIPDRELYRMARRKIRKEC